MDLGPNSYPIAIGHGLTESLPRLLAPLAGRKTVLVSSRPVWSRHGAKVEKSLRRLGPFTRVLIPDGERHKDRRTLNAIHDAFVKAGLGRDGLVVAFGGGVVDLDLELPEPGGDTSTREHGHLVVEHFTERLVGRVVELDATAAGP